MYFQNVAANLNKFDAIAEAAIGGTYEVAQRAHSQKLEHYDYSVSNALNVLETLAQMIPDSDILRAEQLAFRFETIAKATKHEATIERGRVLMAKVRAREAYRNHN